MARDIKDTFLTLVILTGMIAILGCVSNPANTAHNNSTVNSTVYFPNISANVTVDPGNFNDSADLTSAQKLSAIRIALNSWQHSQECANVYAGEVLPSNASVKPLWADSGFLNISGNIVSVPLEAGGSIMGTVPCFGYSFVVYVNVSNWAVAGVDTYDRRATYCFTETDLPENSTMYHQLAGATRTGPDYNTTRMSLSVVTSENDTNSIYPLILDRDNFEKFRNGSRYEALQYTDYGLNQTRLVNGNTPLLPQYGYNGSDSWVANISVSYRMPAEDVYYRPTNYYIVLQNKANRTIPVKLNIVSAFFF